MSSSPNYLQNQIKDWHNRGVISDEIAQTLLDDVSKTGGATDSQRRPFSFFNVVAAFAAISFAAAILMFISANWEAIPRLVKVTGIFVLIVGGLVGGAFAHGRGKTGQRLEEALYLIAGAAYVGGVALVGQMYHLPGSIGQAMFGFAIGLGAAGLMVRSRVLTFGALGAIVWWYLEQPNPEQVLSVDFAILLAFCAVAFGVSRLWGDRWLGRAAAVALLIGLLPWAWDRIEALFEFYENLDPRLRLGIWLFVLFAAAVVVALERYRPERMRGLPGFSEPRAAWAFAAGLLALFALHGESFGEGLMPLIIVGPMTLAFTLFALFTHGARSAPIRYTGYVVFVGEILFLYGETVATLLGTAGFFLVIAVVLSLIALVILIVERRLKKDEDQ